MKKVLLSAFACDPTKGSEPSCGWNWAVGLAKEGFEVHCITREISRSGIQTEEVPENLKFSYVQLPPVLERLYSASAPTMYLYYILWQWRAYKRAIELHRASTFDLVHHITWGNLKIGTFMHKLPIPLVFGPAGGGQVAPVAFKEYFGSSWRAERNRNRLSRFFLNFNPMCRAVLKKAAAVLVSNEDSLCMAKSYGASNAELVLDVGVPDWFLPGKQVKKNPQPGTLKLLWVGRFFALKGVLLLPEIMKELRDYPGITLTVVGDGLMRSELTEKIAEYSLEDQVYLKGWVPFEEVRRYYADCDVFIFTSLRDSGGVQLVEAMSFGMPVVTLDLHGAGLIVSDDRGVKCACTTPDLAIKNIKEAILNLYEHPDLVGQLSEGAFRFAGTQAWSKKIPKIADEFYP